MDHNWIRGAVDARAAVRAFEMPDVSDLAEGYALQDGYAARVATTMGGTGGFKLAVNGAPQMAHFGVSEPVSARIFSGEIYESGVTLSAENYMSLFVEPELCAVLGPNIRDVTGPVDRDGARRVIDRFHAAIELIDQRGVALPSLKLPQAVALNVFNAGIVLGAADIAPEMLDLPKLDVTVRFDKGTVDATTGTAPQDPIDAVMWLINHLLARGVAMAPGMVVMCGTHVPIRQVPEDTREISVAMSGLGTVSFTRA